MFYREENNELQQEIADLKLELADINAELKDRSSYDVEPERKKKGKGWKSPSAKKVSISRDYDSILKYFLSDLRFEVRCCSAAIHCVKFCLFNNPRLCCHGLPSVKFQLLLRHV